MDIECNTVTETYVFGKWWGKIVTDKKEERKQERKRERKKERKKEGKEGKKDRKHKGWKDM